MVLGVALGVAVVVAIDLANASARRGFARSTEAVTGRATHQVRGGPSGLPEEVYRRLRVEHGVRPSAPVVEGVVIAARPRPPAAARARRRPARRGAVPRPPGRRHARRPGLRARSSPTRAAVLVGAALAERYGLAPGSPAARAGRRPRRDAARARARGRAPTRRAGARSTRLLLLDVGAAQRLLGMAGRISHIDLIARRTRTSRRIARAAPAGRAPRPGERAGRDGRAAHRRLRAEPHRAEPARARGRACSSSTTRCCSASCSGARCSARCGRSGATAGPALRA